MPKAFDSYFDITDKQAKAYTVTNSSKGISKHLPVRHARKVNNEGELGGKAQASRETSTYCQLLCDPCEGGWDRDNLCSEEKAKQLKKCSLKNSVNPVHEKEENVLKKHSKIKPKNKI